MDTPGNRQMATGNTRDMRMRGKNNAAGRRVRRNTDNSAKTAVGGDRMAESPVGRRRTPQDASRAVNAGTVRRNGDTEAPRRAGRPSGQPRGGMAGRGTRRVTGSRSSGAARRGGKPVTVQHEPSVSPSSRFSRRWAGRFAFVSLAPLVLSAVLCGASILMTDMSSAVSNADGGSVVIPADDIVNMAKAAIPEPVPDDSIDWASLLARNGEVKAWMDLQVGNVGIHEPVVQPSASEGNPYYLKHDLDRRYTYIGCIFYDMRDSDDGTSRLAYGHHFTGSTRMLSSINDAYNQPKFDVIQPMRWRQPDGTDDIYVPVMSMKVYKTYQKCQSFSARTPQDTQELLQSMATDAQAKSANLDNIVANAERCVTFVTCASNIPNQPWRTLVVFAKMPSNQ